MKMIKMALLAGSAVAVSAAAAHADDLDALKAQIETLNARVAAMEAAPAVPAGYQLVAISEGDRVNTPGLEWTGRELAAYGNKATYISVLPTADAPAGATITWSGYARAGLVFSNSEYNGTIKHYTSDDNGDTWIKDGELNAENDWDDDDIDVKARGQLRVTAATDTAVGEVGVDIRLRGNFNGNGAADIYSDVAWGYWAMTPELTFGGGYAGSLGQIGYGYDGACTCYYTDNADAGNFNPGDTTQMRLTYGSGPFTMAVALEDASIRAGGDNFSAADSINGDELGASGEVKYSGDVFSGEIAGVWRGLNDEFAYSDSLWQVGAGLSFSLGDMASLSFAAAMGEGPIVNTYEGEIVSGSDRNNTWWGVSGLASANLNDAIHAEIGAAYKSRSIDGIRESTDDFIVTTSDGDWDQWSILGGIYYDPVDQLTIGLEGEWINTNYSSTARAYENDNGSRGDVTDKFTADADSNSFSVDLVSVWRF